MMVDSFTVETGNKFEILEVQKCTTARIQPRFFRCKIGTQNVRTASSEDKIMLILREANKSGLIVFCLQEFRWMNVGEMSMIVDGIEWVIIWSGGSSRQHGVATCFRMCDKYKNRIEIGGFQQISDRLLAVDCSISQVRLINGYAPTHCYSLVQKEIFYENLLKLATMNQGSKRKIICLGDFNSYASVLHENCCFDGNLERLDSYESTESGQLFLDFCADAKLSVLNTFFRHKWSNRATYYSIDGRLERVYDTILAGRWIRRFTTDTRVRNGINVDSDHRAVVASFAFPAYKRDRIITKSRRKTTKTRKIDYKTLLSDPEISENYLEIIENALNSGDNLDIDKLTNILESATTVIPTKAKRGKVNPWDADETLQELLADRDRVSRINEPVKWKTITKTIKTHVKSLRNTFLQIEADKINLVYFNRELEKCYAKTKDHRMADSVRMGAKCDDTLMRAHVESHLNKRTEREPPPEITTNIPDCLKITSKTTFTNPISAEIPSKDEFYDAIFHLKNNRASTDTRAECLKIAIESESFFESLYDMITTIWTTRTIPESWRYSKITCIFKKGDRCLPENYRTLSVSAVLLKAIMSIILWRSREWYESTLLDIQNGFRLARGTADPVFIVKNLIRIAKTGNKSIYALALDLRAAYDWINRSWVWLCIAARNTDSEYEEELDDLFGLVRELYGRTYSYMAGDEKEQAFETTSGLLQGAVESPPLFSVFCDTILRLFEEKMRVLGVGGLKFKYFIPASASTRAQRVMGRLEGENVVFSAAYCDDIFLMAESIEELQIMTTVLEELFTRFGLTISVKKTKTLILNYQGTKENYPKSIVTIQNINIDNISTFKYLGVKLNNTEIDTGKTEIQYRINTANYKFRELKHVFTNLSIKFSIRIMFYNAYVRSRLCYLCGLWCISDKIRRTIHKTHINHLRSMISGGWRRKGGTRDMQDEVGFNFARVYSNEKIYKIAKTEPVLEFVDAQRAKWVAHVVRCDNDRLVKQTMFEVTQRTRQGNTTSILDQFLKQTRTYDMSDSTVYKACIDRNLFSELDDRGIVFASAQREIE